MQGMSGSSGELTIVNVMVCLGIDSWMGSTCECKGLLYCCMIAGDSHLH
jgi:hypothetical protein